MRSFTQGTRARLDMRVSLEMKALFQVAALYENGGDLTAFMLAAAIERAARVLAEQESITLDAASRERFQAALRNPARPSESLRRLMAGEDEPVRSAAGTDETNRGA